MKRLLIPLSAVLLGVSLLFGETKPSLLVLNVEGIINPVISDYVQEGVRRADENGAVAVLIELNTPGGLLDSTRSIIGAMINAKTPVIVYVSPRGSRATSAGVFITVAADVAAMAPETHIGAAHPVNIDGTSPSDKPKDQAPSSVMEEKMVSDAAAYIRGLAVAHKRNIDWVEKAVRESVSVTSDEALKLNVIDLVATDRAELLKKIEGKKISKAGKDMVLTFKDVPQQEYPLSAFRKFLQMLAHPNVAYILMTIGIYGIIYELSAPGVGLGGAIGVISLLLAFFSLQILPTTTVGLVLILVGIAMMALELTNPSHGIFLVGGLAAFAFGSFMLIDVGRQISYPRVSLTLILPTVTALGLFFGLVLKKIVASERVRPKIGMESLVGMVTEIQEDLTDSGTVYLNGELWTARSAEPLRKGEKAVVARVEGNTLIVKRA